MMIPDLRSLILSFLVLDIAITLILIILWYHNRKRFRGTHLWVINFVFQTLTIILIALRGYLPDWISFIVSNSLSISGTLLGLIAFGQFYGLKRDNRINYLVLILFITIHSWFTFADNNLAARNLNFTIAMLIYSFQYSWIAFFRLKNEERKTATGIGLVFLGYVILNSVRVFKTLVVQNGSNDYFQADLPEKIFFTGYQVLFVFLTYSLVLMYNRKLLNEITAHEEKYLKAFQTSPYAIIITRYSDGTILEVNNGFTRISGYEYRDVIGKTTNEVHLWIKEEDRKEFVGELDKNSVSRKKRNFRIRSGEIITGIISAELIDVNNEKLVFTSLNDITELTRKENLLKEKVSELERMNKFMTGRELRMTELKKEINELCVMLGMKERY